MNIADRFFITCGFIFTVCIASESFTFNPVIDVIGIIVITLVWHIIAELFSDDKK